MITVSVIMPCLNEKKYIQNCLDSLLANDYDKRYLEIIIVDGMSSDGTREIVAKYCEKYEFIKLLDNPQKITPVALNIAILAAESKVILRVDAHAVYESNYFSTLVTGLEKYNADNIGGIRQTAIIKDSSLSIALSLAISHPFTAGNAFYRTGSDKVREVDTVWCGCFHKDLFDKIGYFNENIIRTEDRDFNARIIEAGGKIILDPSTKCTYFPRTNLREYIKWNAYGPFRLFYNHKYTHVKMISWRNMIPAMFIFYQLITLLTLIYSSGFGILLSIPFFIYWAIALFYSVNISYKYCSFSLAPISLLVFAVTHYSYGVGSILGMPFYFFKRLKLMLK